VRIVAADGSHVDIPADNERTPLRFSTDGKALFVINYHPWPMAIERIDLATKAATVVGHIGEGDRPAWLQPVMSEDTKTIAFSVPARTSDLYVLAPPATGKR